MQVAAFAVAENFPVGQFVHVVVAVVSAQYFPAAQFEQVDALVAYMPAPHVVHCDCDPVSVTVPPVQSLHVIDAVLAGMYFPATQLLHVDVLDAYDPAAHVVYVDCPFKRTTYPDGGVLHAVLAMVELSEYVPISHGEHTVAEEAYVPNPQYVQADNPSVVETVPAPHVSQYVLLPSALYFPVPH